ncbi:MAG TPA: TQO small subunit DoxD [Solirubrobacterales bacterium]|nr:TQO small subunit DoxD [Solirubrobacterales bacterium]
MSEEYETGADERPPARSRRVDAGRQGRGGVSPAMALLPLRLFLGVTFVYAGIQKLSDPGFLHPGAPTYIDTQLHGFASGTPGGFILRTFASPHPELAGVGVAIAEILIGLLATAGLFTRVAAACGMGLNLLIFLTASWHTTPYFFGPDIVFTFAWLPFVLAGASGQPAFDGITRRPSAATVRRTHLRATEIGAGGESVATSTRRVLLAEFAGMAVAIGGVSALVKGSYAGPQTLAAGSSSGSGGTRTGGSKGGGKSNVSGSGGSGGRSRWIGALRRSQDRSRQSARQRTGRHLQRPLRRLARHPDPRERWQVEGVQRGLHPCGLHVGYEGGVIVCPCHGGEYNAETGEVIAGPPPSGLAPKKVLEAGGQIYAVPS